MTEQPEQDDATTPPEPTVPSEPSVASEPAAASEPSGAGAVPEPPGAAPPPPAYAPMAPPMGDVRPTFGPAGKVRNIGTCILLAIVTLGIYTYVWVWLTQDETKRHSGDGLGGPLGFVIYLVVSPVTFFLVPYEVSQMMARAGQQSRVGVWHGLWVLLPIVGPIVWFIQVQGELNDYWRSVGAPG
jgi:hypothetical protein